MDVTRIGERLVLKGAITRVQLAAALERQGECCQPLGLICEEMFGVPPTVVEDAWAEQYAELTAGLDPELQRFDEECVRLVTRRQAWQFAVLPLRWEEGATVVATLPQRLARAHRFMARIVPGPILPLMAEAPELAEALMRHHPFPGMTESMLIRGAG
ncbi:MAG: hypothetical protein U0574_08495 [Phycisphaerales bacterium]